MSCTSGEAMEGERQSAFETTMNWSPTKKSGKKKTIEAIDTYEKSAATSSGEDEEEGEQEENKGRKAVEGSGRSVRGATNEKGRGQRAVGDLDPGSRGGVHPQGTTYEGTKGASWSLGPTGGRQLNRAWQQRTGDAGGRSYHRRTESRAE